MSNIKSNSNKQIWATPTFRKFLYEKKAETPDKTLFEIQDDIAELLRSNTIKPSDKKETNEKTKKTSCFPRW